MTAAQTQQLMNQRVAQARHAAMMAELDVSRPRGEAATEGRRCGSTCQRNCRGNGAPWTSWHRHEVATNFVDKLVNLVEADRQSLHSNVVLAGPRSCCGVAPAVLDALDDLQNHVEKARNLRRSWCNSEPQNHQRTANQLVHLLNADLSGDLQDKTPLLERMIKTHEEQTERVFAEYLRIGIWLSNALESAQDTQAHAYGASPLGRLPPRDDVVHESPSKHLWDCRQRPWTSEPSRLEGRKAKAWARTAGAALCARSAASLDTRQISACQTMYSVRQKDYIHNVFLFRIDLHITIHDCGPEIMNIFSVAQDMFVAL